VEKNTSGKNFSFHLQQHINCTNSLWQHSKSESSSIGNNHCRSLI